MKKNITALLMSFLMAATTPVSALNEDSPELQQYGIVPGKIYGYRWIEFGKDEDDKSPQENYQEFDYLHSDEYGAPRDGAKVVGSVYPFDLRYKNKPKENLMKVNLVAGNRLFMGDESGNFNPDRDVTNAEVITAMSRAIYTPDERAPEVPHDIMKDNNLIGPQFAMSLKFPRNHTDLYGHWAAQNYDLLSRVGLLPEDYLYSVRIADRPSSWRKFYPNDKMLRINAISTLGAFKAVFDTKNCKRLKDGSFRPVDRNYVIDNCSFDDGGTGYVKLRREYIANYNSTLQDGITVDNAKKAFHKQFPELELTKPFYDEKANKLLNPMTDQEVKMFKHIANDNDIFFMHFKMSTLAPTIRYLKLKGDANGKYNIYDNLSRAEFAALMFKVLEMEDIVDFSKVEQVYPDVPESHWAYKIVWAMSDKVVFK